MYIQYVSAWVGALYFYLSRRKCACCYFEVWVPRYILHTVCMYVRTKQTTILPKIEPHVIDQYSNERYTVHLYMEMPIDQMAFKPANPAVASQVGVSYSTLYHVAYMYLPTLRHHQHHPLFTSPIRRTYYSFQSNTSAMDQRRAQPVD